MKYVFIPILLFLFVGCKTETKKESLSITSNEIKEMVDYLSSDELKGRHVGSDGIESAAEYIESQFKSYGVKSYFERYRDNFKTKDSVDAYNVVGFIEGKDERLKNELIILGAHYDHIGQGQEARRKSRKGNITESDSIANGANDNASGTAAVLALSKYFAQTRNNKRSILFVLFSGEELGVLGSIHLANKLKEQNLDLYTMVAFEMIGVPLIDKDYQVFLTGYELSNMAKKMNEYIGTEVVGFSEIAVQNNLFKRSDNFPFYEQFNVPCQTISSCDLTNFDYYHHADDEPNQLEYEFMASVINNISIAIEHMSNTSTKEIIMYESE